MQLHTLKIYKYRLKSIWVFGFLIGIFDKKIRGRFFIYIIRNLHIIFFTKIEKYELSIGWISALDYLEICTNRYSKMFLFLKTSILL